MTIIRRTLYQQVEKAVEDDIRDGLYKPGDTLPSEAALAQHYGVSVATVRKALDGLAERRYIERRQGIGTFVTTYTQHGYWNRFQRFQKLSGELTTWNDTLKLCEMSSLPPEAASALGLPAGSEAWHIIRRMQLDDEPNGIDELWLHPRHFPEVRAQTFIDRKPGSLYDFFERTYGVTITEVRDRIRFCEALPQDEAIIGIQPGRPILRLFRTGYTFGREPVEYRIQHVLPDKIQIVLD